MCEFWKFACGHTEKRVCDYPKSFDVPRGSAKSGLGGFRGPGAKQVTNNQSSPPCSTAVMPNIIQNLKRCSVPDELTVLPNLEDYTKTTRLCFACLLADMGPMIRAERAEVEAKKSERKYAGTDNFGYSSQGMLGFGENGNSSWHNRGKAACYPSDTTRLGPSWPYAASEYESAKSNFESRTNSNSSGSRYQSAGSGGRNGSILVSGNVGGFTPVHHNSGYSGSENGSGYKAPGWGHDSKHVRSMSPAPTPIRDYDTPQYYTPVPGRTQMSQLLKRGENGMRARTINVNGSGSDNTSSHGSPTYPNSKSISGGTISESDNGSGSGRGSADNNQVRYDAKGIAYHFNPRTGKWQWQSFGSA